MGDEHENEELGPIDFLYVKFSRYTLEQLKELNSWVSYNAVGAEIFKNVALITTIVSQRASSEEICQGLDDYQSIVDGNMVRLQKLEFAFLEQFCQERYEIAAILGRCIVETAINILYFLQNPSEETILSYKKSSLKEEKRLLDEIGRNIIERKGEILPIEKRMKESILKAFSTNGLEPADLVGFKPINFWEKCKSLNLPTTYNSMYSMFCHAVHGNWCDLEMNHLNRYDKDSYQIDSNWHPCSADHTIGLGSLCNYVNNEYLLCTFSESSDREHLSKIISDSYNLLKIFDQTYEVFKTKK